MRALTIDEIQGVSGGQNQADVVIVTGHQNMGNAIGGGGVYSGSARGENVRTIVQEKKDDERAEQITVIGIRGPNGVGLSIGPGYFAVGVGSPGVGISRVERQEPDEGTIVTTIDENGITIDLGINRSYKARQESWRRRFGTPPGAVPRY
jgi:hypothetical protein